MDANCDLSGDSRIGVSYSCADDLGICSCIGLLHCGTVTAMSITSVCFRKRGGGITTAVNMCSTVCKWRALMFESIYSKLITHNMHVGTCHNIFFVALSYFLAHCTCRCNALYVHVCIYVPRLHS